MSSKSPIDAARHVFTDKAIAEKYLERLRWPTGLSCPDCGSKEIYRRGSGSGAYRCIACQHPWTLRKGTCMEGSKLGLDSWAVACTLYEAGHRSEEFKLRLGQITDIRDQTVAKVLERLDSMGTPIARPPTKDSGTAVVERSAPDGGFWKSKAAGWLIPGVSGLIVGACLALLFAGHLGIGKSASKTGTTRQSVDRHIGEIVTSDGTPAQVSWVGGIRIETRYSDGESAANAADRHMQSVARVRTRLDSLKLKSE